VSFRTDPRFARPEVAADLPDDVLAEINRLWTIVRAFSNVAHDVNNALQVIAGNAELLALQPIADDVARRVETMRAQSLRAASVIDRLLKYARAPATPVQTVDVWPIVESAVALRTASLNRRRIRLTAERSADAPALVTGGHALFLQALIDLLLAAESNPAAVAGAAIVARLTQRDGRVAVDIAVTRPAAGPRVAAADSANGAVDGSRDHLALTYGSELWAAAHLAEVLGGEVVVGETEGDAVLSLLVPPATPRTYS
jgi:nitrogen-specific signal transduction histidine kinase